MVHTLAATAANCNVGTWQQKWNCASNQPVSPAVGHAGYNFGHSLLPALFVLAVVIFLYRAVKKRGKSRSSSPAGARR